MTQATKVVAYAVLPEYPDRPTTVKLTGYAVINAGLVLAPKVVGYAVLQTIAARPRVVVFVS